MRSNSRHPGSAGPKDELGRRFSRREGDIATQRTSPATPLLGNNWFPPKVGNNWFSPKVGNKLILAEGRLLAQLRSPGTSALAPLVGV